MKNLFKYSFFLLALSLVVVSCKKKTAGEKATTGEASGTVASSDNATTLAVNTANSKVYWAATKPGGGHNGTLNISQGKLAVSNGNLVGGSFELDMNSIADLSLEAGQMKDNLEAHLKGTVDEKADDFFNVRKFPKSTFVISKVEAAPAGGEITHTVTGDLTLKGVTKSITIPASVIIDGATVSAVTPSFKINRTEWGINFMSNSVFDDLKDKFIDDEIALNIQMSAGS